MKIIKQGILTTYQDLGRTGYQHLGINPSGAMDKTAIRLLNILLQNPEDEVAIEMHFPAPEISFEEDTLIAIGGAEFTPTINNKEVCNWKTTLVQAGSILKFQRKVSGERAYLVIKGGFNTTEWLGSKSTNLLTAVGGGQIKNGDVLTCRDKSHLYHSKYILSYSILPKYTLNPIIRVIQGNEYSLLKPESRQLFESKTFTISQNSNRMGFRLTGETLELENKTVQASALVSSAVSYGTIQLLPDGKLIILMADHQTTGGYPRIANIASVDLSILAQCGANTYIEFKVISVEEAEELLMEREQDLLKLRASIRILQKQPIISN